MDVNNEGFFATQPAQPKEKAPPEQWSERWYGSGAERGWWIGCGRERIAHLGPSEFAEIAARKIVEAHNRYKLPAQPKEPEPKCNPHPKAPHGFDRNASHANDRYVCECEGWNAYDAGYEAGVIAGIEASMEQEPEQRSVSEHLEPVALDWNQKMKAIKALLLCTDGELECIGEKALDTYCEEVERVYKALYTTPLQRDSSATPLTWEGLTDEERWDCLEVSRRNADCRDALVKAVEAKLKEKNT